MKNPLNNPFKKLIITFYLLIFVTAIFIFFAPRVITILFFLITLIKYFNSKDDAFWLAYAIIISFGVGGIFYEQTQHILSLGKFNITYLSLFSICSLLKHILSPGGLRLGYLRKYYIIYLILFIVLLFYGLSVHGILGGGGSGYRYIVVFLQSTLYLPLIITIPKSLNCYENLIKFSSLIISLVPLNIAGQFYFLYTGASIFEKFGIVEIVHEAQNVLESNRILRPAFGSFSLFFGFIMSLFFYFKQNEEKMMFKKSYLLLLIFLHIASVFITATRGWILLYIIIIGLIILQNSFQQRSSKFFIAMCVFVFLGISIISLSKVLSSHVGKTIDRIYTLERIFEGDKTAGGTNVRLTTRHDRVMEVYKNNSKIFGTGISNEGLNAFDPHTGNQSMLATGGILEVLVFISFFCYLISKTILINKNLLPSNEFKNRILYFITFFIGLLFLHSTSSYKFGIVGWMKYSGAITYVITFISIYNQILLEAKNKDLKIIKANE